MKVRAWCSSYLHFCARKDPKVGGWFYLISVRLSNQRLERPKIRIFII